jgi:hypothetical protein
MPKSKAHPDDILLRAQADLEHLRVLEKTDAALLAKIEARRAERTGRISKLESFIEQFEVYASVPSAEPIMFPLRDLKDFEPTKKGAPKQGGGKRGPVATAILGLEGLQKGLRNAEIIEQLRSKHPELGLPEKDVKAVYNALYGLTKTKVLVRGEGEDGEYRFAPKQIEPPKAKANGGSIPGHVNGSNPSHVRNLQTTLLA